MNTSNREINTNLEEKINSFILENKLFSLKTPEVEEAILKLREHKITFQKIVEFLKKEFDIQTTTQSLSKKYKKMIETKNQGSENE